MNSNFLNIYLFIIRAFLLSVEKTYGYTDISNYSYSRQNFVSDFF